MSEPKRKRGRPKLPVLYCRQKLSILRRLELQPRFAIEIKGRKICTYVADFQYRLDGDLVVEDVKGVRTPVYRLKKKMVEAVYDFAITEI